MQTTDNTPGPSGTTVTIDRQELEKLIRDSLRSAMDAQQSQKETADAYIKRLHEIDARATEYIQKATHETAFSYKLSYILLIIGYITAVAMLIVGLFLAYYNVDQPDLFSIGLIFIVTGILWFISLQTRNLSKNARLYVTNLAKLNIIFTSYLRQIHQMDAVFEGLVKSGNGLAINDVEQMINCGPTVHRRVQ